MDIKQIDRLIQFNKTLSGASIGNEAGVTVAALEELKLRIQSDIKPCDKYLTNTPGEQMEHIDEEYFEVVNAFQDYLANPGKLPHLIEEINDLQVSCETMHAILVPAEPERWANRRTVIAKNAERKYYEVEK